MKIPSDTEKIQVYEGFLHDLCMGAICGNHEMIKQLVSNADRWSYMHRVGNGELSEEEQQEAVASAFWRLREVKLDEK